MIEVSVRMDGITVNGHAGHAEPGNDIVCAAVSALTETLIRSLEDLTEDKIEYELSPGRADVSFRNLSDSGKLLVDSFFIGICGIAKAHPENITIT